MPANKTIWLEIGAWLLIGLQPWHHILDGNRFWFDWLHEIWVNGISFLNFFFPQWILLALLVTTTPCSFIVFYHHFLEHYFLLGRNNAFKLKRQPKTVILAAFKSHSLKSVLLFNTICLDCLILNCCYEDRIAIFPFFWCLNFSISR